MKNFTKIICTLGPSSSRKETLLHMARRGMNIARLNFSHGSHETHAEMIKIIRKVNMGYGTHIKILQDLEGYRIRVGHFDRPKDLKARHIVYMSGKPEHSKDLIPIDYDDDLKKIEKGFNVFIDDGNLQLKVIDHEKGRLKLRVLRGGLLKQRKGVNIPRLKLRANILTVKDQRDLDFGLSYGVDYVAQSFVRNKEDMERIAKIVKSKNPDCKVIAKIENEEGVRNIDGIAEVADGIMVARGDLGVALPIYKIPMLQKYILRHCTRKKKMAIVATQMLETMTENIRPTRAEVSDVANAILDGADSVMLSGETAVGKYPSQTVMMMNKIIYHTEKHGFPSL